MTLRILGIVGSPRKGGNTEILTEHLLKGAAEMGAETELVSLSDLNLNYCRGCHHCLETGVCAISDDVESLKEKLLRADGIVLASSTQAQTISGNMKVFIDRLLLHVFKQSLQGKYVVSVSVGGFYGMDKVTKYLNDTAWAMGANMAEKTIKTFGKIDILVNNAAIMLKRPTKTHVMQPSDQITVEEWDSVMSFLPERPWFSTTLPQRQRL
ncbi:MAG: NAD(P)H-dependent oxidoreductase [Thermodesulfovibrionales bacterium]|nr:NAD(P)H-dependent oxidoreductase [Thermodesulfovibrionales bacterium]